MSTKKKLRFEATDVTPGVTVTMVLQTSVDDIELFRATRLITESASIMSFRIGNISSAKTFDGKRRDQRPSGPGTPAMFFTADVIGNEIKHDTCDPKTIEILVENCGHSTASLIVYLEGDAVLK